MGVRYNDDNKLVGGDGNGNGEFKCSCCNLKLATLDCFKRHYNTELHHYNVKRKLAQLPAIAGDDFERRKRDCLSAVQRQLVAQQTSVYCRPCQKHFKTQQTYANHLNSKKHKALLEQFVAEHPHEAAATNRRHVDAGAVTAITAKRLVYKFDDQGEIRTYIDDDERSSGDDDGAKPSRGIAASKRVDNGDEDDEDEDDFELVDVPAELPDAGAVVEDSFTIIPRVLVNVSNNCLFCNHVSEQLNANLAHMQAAHTFTLPNVERCTDIAGLLQHLAHKIAHTYTCIWCDKDFRNVDAVRKHMHDKNHCRLYVDDAEALAEYEHFYNYGFVEIADVVDNKSLPDIRQVPSTRNIDLYELVTPTGRVVGHRAAPRYRPQHLKVQCKLLIQRRLAAPCQLRQLSWKKKGDRCATTAVVKQQRRYVKVLSMQMAKQQLKLSRLANKLHA